MSDNNQSSNSAKLEELLELTRENNEMLRDLRARARWGLVFRIFYWGLILASLFGTYIYLQPYTDQIRNNFGSFGEMFNKFKDMSSGMSSAGQFEKIIDSFKSTN